MKKLFTFAFVFVLTIVLGYGLAFSGNGAPNGAHYNLNIIGVNHTKSKDFNVDDYEEMNSNGHRIFVALDGKTKIMLGEGEYHVIDYNGTDGIAKFQLPNPDPDGDGVTEYSVYVRALGKPGGYAEMQSCYTDGTEEYCAIDFGLNDGVSDVTPIEIKRQNPNGKGKSTFTNVSKDLLYVDYCTLWDLDENSPTYGECLEVDQIPLFSEEAEGYFWDYDNNGLKLAQFRFYEVPTDTSW